MCHQLVVLKTNTAGGLLSEGAFCPTLPYISIIDIAHTLTRAEPRRSQAVPPSLLSVEKLQESRGTVASGCLGQWKPVSGMRVVAQPVPT